MAVSMLCFTFLLAIVAINQSLADPNSATTPGLVVNNGTLTREEHLEHDFQIPCAVIQPPNTEYEPRWQMKDNSTVESKPDAPLSLGPLGWYKTSNLIFDSFQAEHQGNWTCELWSVTEKKVVDNQSVKLTVKRRDQVTWGVKFENNLTEYLIERGASIRWTLVINNTQRTDDFTIHWYWPNTTEIQSALNRGEQKFLEPSTRKQNFTLSSVTIAGDYTVKVSKNNEQPKILVAKVSFESHASSTTLKPIVSTTKHPAPSSGIRMESSFLALVVVWFTCRPVAFAPTA